MNFSILKGNFGITLRFKNVIKNILCVVLSIFVDIQIDHFPQPSYDGWAISDLQRNYAGIPEDFCPKISDEEIRSNYRRPKTSTSSTLKSVSSDIKITVEDESKNTRVLLDNKLTDSVLSSNITKIVEEPEKEAIAQESAEQSERAKDVIINDDDNNNTAHEAPEESQLRPEEAEAVSLKSAVSNSTNAESTPLP